MSLLLCALALLLAPAPAALQEAFAPAGALAPAGLEPFRINRLLARGAAGANLEGILIYGIDFRGGRSLLFRSSEVRQARETLCYAYLDADVQAVEVELVSGPGRSSRLRLSVERSPYRIAVYGEGLAGGTVAALVPDDPAFYVTASAGDLGPGDLYLLGEELDANGGAAGESLLARGIHLLLLGGSGAQAATQGPWWRGQRLAPVSRAPTVPGLSGAPTVPGLSRAPTVPGLSRDEPGIKELLAAKKKELLAFKQRYHSLIAEASFQGIRAQSEAPLSFRGAQAEDIAYTLEGELFRSRLGAIHRLALIAFYLPALCLVALLRKVRLLLPLLGGLLLLFVLVIVLYPGGGRAFTLKLNLSQAQPAPLRLRREGGSPDLGGDLARPLSAGLEESSFSPLDFNARDWVLRYRMAASFDRRLPLSWLQPARLVKCNQRPTIVLSGGRYTVEFRNPLKAWSLHEPE